MEGVEIGHLLELVDIGGRQRVEPFKRCERLLYYVLILLKSVNKIAADLCAANYKMLV